MDDLKIQRINELSKKSKTTGLTNDELEERKKLREEYIKAFKDNLKSNLDNVVIVDKNGNKTPLNLKNKIN